MMLALLARLLSDERLSLTIIADLRKNPTVALGLPRLLPLGRGRVVIGAYGRALGCNGAQLRSSSWAPCV